MSHCECMENHSVGEPNHGKDSLKMFFDVGQARKMVHDKNKWEVLVRWNGLDWVCRMNP